MSVFKIVNRLTTVLGLTTVTPTFEGVRVIIRF